MDTIRIYGGTRLEGEIPIHGAKNSALPLLAATLLAADTTTLTNCPHLADVSASIAILRHLGCRVVQEGDAVSVDAAHLRCGQVPDDLMRAMRSSIVFLGAIVARCGEAVLTHPGGCELGPRPIDLHLSALRRLGVEITEEHGQIHCRAGHLRGAEITLPFPSVGATENILLAACTAEGTTVLRHAAREPEIADLCAFLNACGARISGGDSGTLVIEGVPRLHGACHRVMADRIEAATYLAAAAVTGGTLTLTHCPALPVSPVFAPLEQAGCTITAAGEKLHITAPTRLRALGAIRTLPYPGFPTDAAAPLLAAAWVVNIVPWNNQSHYDRLGLEEQYMELLGVKIPMYTIPITPGRNLAVILEVAAMNNRQKKMGYNAAIEFTEQINNHFNQNMNQNL